MIKKVLLLLFLVISFNAFSQDNEKQDSNSKISILFGITDLIKFQGYSGSMLSGKYQFSERNAIQLGLSASYDKPKNSNSDNLSTGQKHTTEDDGREYSFSSTLFYVRYLKQTKPVSLYSSIGLDGFYSVEEKTSSDENVSNQNRNIVYGYGILGNLGVEWSITNYFSLFLEYGVGFTKSIREYKEEQVYATYSRDIEKNGSQYNFYNKGILLGLAIHI
jgi:hypothetical protein